MIQTLKRKIANIALAGIIVFICVGVATTTALISTAADTSVAHADEWKKSENRWWYQTGKSYATGWKQIGGTWYYFDNNGWMKTGWQSIGGKWYYFNGSGVMQAGRWVGNYYVKNDGTMATNQWIGDYHVNANGVWDDTKYSNPSSVNALNDPISLIGKLVRQERTTDQTHMGWASVDYILQLSNPVNITYKPAVGSTTTEPFKWLQIASAEIYLATDPNANSTLGEILIDDLEPFVGRHIKITGTIYDSGTAHTLGSARFLDYSIKPL